LVSSFILYLDNIIDNLIPASYPAFEIVRKRFLGQTELIFCIDQSIEKF